MIEKKKFIERIQEQFRLTSSINTMQVNLGKICNLSCKHCHVEAGPKRTETMTKETMYFILQALKKHSFSTLDITGGAPEMNEHFVWFIQEARKIVSTIIVRTNLVIMKEKGYTNLAEFYAKNKINVVASLPCYTKDNVDKIRGDQVFDNSISIIQQLNTLGYGTNNELILDFVYNPSGPFLPGKQATLEEEYKKILREKFGIIFNRLFTITNVPIGRFLVTLKAKKKSEEYFSLLEKSFNPHTIENLMCRHQISVGFDGILYDCDFNQIKEMPVHGITTIEEFSKSDILLRKIKFDEHCYACTAGLGSSCCGEVI
jgi:radical SAM/Cys-rich protein